MRAFYLVSAVALLANGANAQNNKIIVKDIIANSKINASLDKNDAIFANDKSSFDLYRINAKSGQILNLTLNSSEFRPIIEIGNIKNEELCPICNFSGADSENNASVKFEVEEDGPVFVRVSNNEAGTFGKYSLVLNVATAPVSTIKTIAMGKTIEGKLDGTEKPNQDGEGFDIYQAKLKKGDIFQVDLTSKDFDPYLEIEGPLVDGVKFSKNDDENGEGKNPRILMTAPISGTYYFKVYSNNNKGNYSIKMGAPTKYEIAPTQIVKINNNIIGKLTEKTIDYRNGDKIFAINYKVKFEAGKKYWISAKSNDFDPRIEIGIIGLDNKIDIIDSDDDGGKDNDALILFTSDDDFEYLVRVTHLISDDDAPLNISETTGDFEFIVKEAEIAPKLEKGKAAKINDVILGEFKDGQSRAWNYFLEDFYEIELKKDQRIQAILSPLDENSKILPFVSVGKGDDVINFENFADGYFKDTNTGSVIRFKADEDGKYLIRIQNEDLDVFGKYKLSLSELPDNSAAIEPVKIKIGEEITSSLDLKDKSEGKHDLPYEMYVFDAIAGETYDISQKSEIFDSVFGIKALNSDEPFILYDDEANDYFNAQTNFTPKISGKYLIKATALNGNELGEYKLKITKK